MSRSWKVIAPLTKAAGRCVQRVAYHVAIRTMVALPVPGGLPRQCFNANGDPKVRHKSREDARAHRRSLIEAGRADATLQVYECNVCACWHVGHRRRGGRGGRRRRGGRR